MQKTLYYVLDPMCSWCWGFAENFDRLCAVLPADVQIKLVMGGLAPDSDDPMPEETRLYVQAQWRKVQAATGAEFNWDFWTQCAPRRSTYPACRAVITARLMEPTSSLAMLKAIQHAYYLQARNPSDASTLIELAAELGLDADEFSAQLNGQAVNTALAADFDLRKELSVRAFPTVLLKIEDKLTPLLIGQTTWENLQMRLHEALS